MCALDDAFSQIYIYIYIDINMYSHTSITDDFTYVSFDVVYTHF